MSVTQLRPAPPAISQQYRAAWAVLLTLLAILLAAADVPGLARAATPTPTPTSTPPGFNVNSNFSSMVDNNAALPWPLPALPTFPAASATPTLYAATPAHGTTYPGQAGTATMQVGAFTGPVNSMQTPVASLLGSGPTPDAGELNTGVDLGGGAVSMVQYAEDVGDSLGPVIGTGKAFAIGVIDFVEYAPTLSPIMIAELVGLVVAAFLGLILMIIIAGNWLVNMVIKVVTMIGSFVG